MLYAFLILLSAGPPVVSPSLLAPGPQDLAAALSTTQKLLGDAEVVGIATARLQNRLAELLAAGAKDCAPPELLSLTARANIFVTHHRDATQSARAQDKRLTRLLAATTIEPLLDPATLRQIDVLHQRLQRQIQLFFQLRSWHGQYVTPLLRACKPALVTTEGLADPAPRPANEIRSEVAVIGIRGGMVCPVGVRADDDVVVIADGQACYSAAEGDCYCKPGVVLPGAVLGP